MQVGHFSSFSYLSYLWRCTKLQFIQNTLTSLFIFCSAICIKLRRKSAGVSQLPASIPVLSFSNHLCDKPKAEQLHPPHPFLIITAFFFSSQRDHSAPFPFTGEVLLLSSKIQFLALTVTFYNENRIYEKKKKNPQPKTLRLLKWNKSFSETIAKIKFWIYGISV